MERPSKIQKITQITNFCFLLHLPEDIIIKILLDILSTGYMHFLRAKATCKRLKEVGESEYFYRSVDFFSYVCPWSKGTLSPQFHRQCHIHENPSYLLRIGVSELFYKGRIESGVQLIKRAAELRFPPARYIYYMMVKTLWDDDVSRRRGFTLQRETTYAIRQFIYRKDPKVWNQEPCDFFRTSEAKFFISPVASCKCADYNPWCNVDDDKIKSQEMCDQCYWIIESLCFFKIITSFFASYP